MTHDLNKNKDPNLQDQQKNRTIPGKDYQQGGTSQKQKDLEKGKNIDKDKKSW